MNKKSSQCRNMTGLWPRKCGPRKGSCSWPMNTDRRATIPILPSIKNHFSPMLKKLIGTKSLASHVKKLTMNNFISFADP